MSVVFPASELPRFSSRRSIFQYIRYQRIGYFTGLADFVLILGVSIATGIAYSLVVFETEGDLSAYILVGAYSGFVFIVLCRILGLYEPNSLLSAGTQIRGVLLAWGAVLLFVTSIFFLLKTGSHYSRGGTIFFGLFGFGAIIGFRALIGSNLSQALASGTLAGQRAIVIGDPGELAEKSALYLLRTYGARELLRFELPPAADHARSNVVDEIAVIDESIRAAQASHAEQVMLALSWADAWRRDLICERLRVLPLPVFLLPDRSVASVLSAKDGVRGALAAIEVQQAPLSRQNLLIKRILDLMISGFGLVMLSPLLLVTCLAIKLDSPGPVVFRQRRKGFSGREFEIYKFRTMNVLEDGPCIRQAQRNDCRVTKLGRLLRASSIDELPQLFNVLVGDMSLVGPRPHAVAHDDEYCNVVDNYAFRHHVKPGITGWAQINGFRGETADLASMSKRIQLDLWYINNWSWWLDFRILARTSVVILKSRNAY